MKAYKFSTVLFILTNLSIKIVLHIPNIVQENRLSPLILR